MNMGDPTPHEPSRYSPPGGTEGAPGSPGPAPRYPAPGQPYAGSAPPPGAVPPAGSVPPPSGPTAPQAASWPQPERPYPGPGQPYQGGHQAGAAGQGPLSPTEERTWAMAAHLSSVLGVWIFFLGALGPLVVLLVQGQRSPYVRAQAVEALNFNISVLIYSIVAWILVFVLIGLLIVGALFVFWLLFTIIATVKASNGEPYRYPLTIRMVS